MIVRRYNLFRQCPATHTVCERYENKEFMKVPTDFFDKCDVKFLLAGTLLRDALIPIDVPHLRERIGTLCRQLKNLSRIK